MRTPNRTGQFKKDYRRETKGRHRHILDAELRRVLEMLLADATLPARYYDHALTGEVDQPCQTAEFTVRYRALQVFRPLP